MVKWPSRMIDSGRRSIRLVIHNVISTAGFVAESINSIFVLHLENTLHNKGLPSVMTTRSSRLIKSLIILLILSLISLFNVLPILRLDFSTAFLGDDFSFHVERVLALSNIFQSPVNFNMFGHAASLANVFYPWETVYPLYLIYSATSNFIFSYKLFYFLLTLITSLLAYWCIFKTSKDTFSALCFATLYIFSFYRISNFFIRAALGEVVSMTFLPLVLLGLYYILFENFKKWRILTIGMALIGYSHALSLFLTSAFVLIAAVVMTGFIDAKTKRLMSLLKAGFWAILLCSPYLVLVANTSSKNDLYMIWTQPLKGLPLWQWLSNSLSNQMYPNPDVRSSLGASVVLALVIALIIFVLFKRARTPFNTFCLFSGMGSMLLTSSIFPWALANQTLFSKIQFVWRLNTYTSLLILVSFSLLLGTVIPKASVTLKPILLLGLTVALIISSSSSLTTFAKNKAEKTPRDPDIAKTVRNVFYGDYAPKQVTNQKNLQQVLQKRYFLNGQPIQPSVKYTDSVYTIKATNKTGKEATLKVPAFWYSCQTVTVNNQPAPSRISAAGTTLLNIPNGKSTITISYDYPKLLLVFILIAVLSLIFLCMSSLDVRNAVGRYFSVEKQ